MTIQTKLPIDYRCVIFNSEFDETSLKEFGKYPTELFEKDDRSYGIFNFIDEKIRTVKFPNYPSYVAEHDYQVRSHGKKFATDRFYVESQSVVMLPKTYDNSNDNLEHKKKKLKFIKSMEEFGHKITGGALKHVHFGTSDFGWVNEFLSYLYDKYKQHYINGYLPIFNDFKDECYWIKNQVDFPYPKAYYLSDIERYLNTDYDIDTDDLYEWVCKNIYIEGRYWERFFDYNPTLKLFNGTKASKNVEASIGLIKAELDFDGDEFPIFIDYYKEIKLH